MAESTITQLGCMDESISEHLKCYIKQGDIQIVGLLPEGYSSSFSQNWNSPFEEDTPGSAFQKVGNVVQAATNVTSISRFNSILTWEGGEPETITLDLDFEAEENALQEVKLPAVYLKMFSAPTFNMTQQQFSEQLNNPSVEGVAKQAYETGKNILAGKGAGRRPSRCFVNIGNNLILRDCVITEVNITDPMKYTKEGIPTKLTVSVTFKSYSVKDRNDIWNNYLGIGL